VRPVELSIACSGSQEHAPPMLRVALNRQWRVLEPLTEEHTIFCLSALPPKADMRADIRNVR
jgi:hypothetical protein